MEKYLFLIFLFLLELILGSSTSISPEAYWKLKLPYTPMPQSILNSLAPAPVEQGGRGQVLIKGVQPSAKESLASIKGYIRLLFYRQSLKSLNPRYLPYDKQGLDSSYPKYLSYNNKQEFVSTNSYGGLLAYDKNGLHSENPKYESYNKQGLASSPGYIGSLSYNKAGPDSNNREYLSYKKQALSAPDNSGPYDSSFSYKVQPDEDSYGDEAAAYSRQPTQAKKSTHDDDHSSATKDQVFFVEKDLHLGTTKTLNFQKSTRKGMFLPRQVSNQIPFQSNKIQETLEILSLDPESKEAGILSKRIELCEEPTIEGVEKKCVTSLESMVDYVISLIGTNVKALTTTQVEKDSKMEYTFKGVKKLVKDYHETVVCHKLGYPYALFFCHRTTTIRSYLVKLVGKDGSKIEALAACHKESNDFLDNYAKNVLHVAPGSTHICHFPPAEDTIIWVPKN